MDELNNILEAINDNIKDLGMWSVENNDMFLEEIESLKEKVEEIKDQQWKIGVMK